jgi:hypothetical protein
LSCFIHTPCIVLNSNATFAFPTPHKSQLLSLIIWETRDQRGPGVFPPAMLSPYCYLPNHKSFGYSEVLIWFRDGTFRVGHW